MRLVNNKSDISIGVSVKVSFPYPDREVLNLVDKAINLILEQMSETLSNGKRVEIRGFGSFKVRKYGSEVTYSRNPQTGEVSYKKRKPRVLFKAGKAFKRSVNN